MFIIFFSFTYFIHFCYWGSTDHSITLLVSFSPACLLGVVVCGCCFCLCRRHVSLLFPNSCIQIDIGIDDQLVENAPKPFAENADGQGLWVHRIGNAD